LPRRYLKVIDDTRDSGSLSGDFRGALFGRATLDYAIERNDATVGVDVDSGQGLHASFGGEVGFNRRRNAGVVNIRSRAFLSDFSAPRD